MIIAGLACVTLGVISLVRGKGDKEKLRRGRRITYLGVVLLIVFIPVLVRAIYKQTTMGESYIFLPLFLAFFFLPLIELVALACLVFFLVIGITSLQTGYKRNKEGKSDKESIVLGYVMIIIGLVVTISLAMFVFATFKELADSIKRSVNRHSSSINNQTGALISYLLTKFNK